MILFLPFVGFLLSLLIIGVHQLFQTSWYISLVFSLLYLILYGFIHTEAVADVVDAIYATHGGKDPYVVIKEPTVGAMGLLYTVSFLILKIASLSYILYEQMYLEFIVITIISRLMVLFSVQLNEFKSSFITMIKIDLNSFNTLIAFISYSSFSYFIIGIEYLWLLILASFVSFLIIKSLSYRLRFLNGDVLGFNLEVNELILMMIVLSI